MGAIGLDELPTGSEAEIESLSGGGAFAGRLAALGFVPGSRVALGRSEAGSIRARRID